MKFGNKTSFDKNFLLQNMMGPNCLRLLEELTQKLKLQPGMRVLDLGCGTGLTSIFLAQEFDVRVFATDLWISASDNYERIKQFGLEDQIIPIHAQAYELPYANSYFDAIISIDAFHYFGAKPDFLDTYLIPLLKKEGIIAVSIPGLLKDFFDEVPEVLLPYWQEDMNFYSAKWWQSLWEQSPNIAIKSCFSHICHQQAWDEWLQCDNPYAKTDIEMMKAENGKYFDTIGIIAKLK